MIKFLGMPVNPASLLERKYVTLNYPIMTAAMSAYPYDPGLEHLYNFESVFTKETICGAIRQGNTLLVPRESVPYALSPNDFRTTSPSTALDCKITWRHEQETACRQSLQLLKQGKCHIFEASTGWGKTVAGGWIASQLGQPTMIVVTKQDLVDQWRDSLINILGIPPNLVGHVQQDVCTWKKKLFVIGMVQSLIIPYRYPPDMYRYFGLLILDEVHQMAADCFVRSCQMFPARYRLGFSATPNRQDGKTKLLHWHIGPTMVIGKVIAMTPKVLVRQTGWKIPAKKKLIGNAWQYIPIPHAPGRMTLVTKALASSDPRNLETVNFVTQAYQKGRRTLIMSDLIDHLHRLFQMLTGAGIPGQEIGYYIGGMKKHELTATKTRQVVLATYQMCSTGTDCPTWDTLVMATPRANVKQAIGRVLRASDGKRQPVILDLVDANSIFQSFHLSRVKQYYSIGAEVVRV